MPGHGKADDKPSVAQQISEMRCYQQHIIRDRVWEIQAGRRICVGKFNHCLRRYQPPMPHRGCEPIQTLSYAGRDCTLCRYEVTTWESSINVYLWRTKLTREAVVELMGEQMDKFAARARMEIQARGVRYTEAEAAENADKPKPRPELPEPEQPAAAQEPVSEEVQL